jgi:hypothetical protein
MTDIDEGQRGSGKDRRSWVFAAAVAGALVLVAVVTVFYAMGRQDASYASESPEAAFQRYAQAWDAGDAETAYASLSARAKTRVPQRDFREAITWSGDEATRVWIDERTGTDDLAVLVLTVETSDGGWLGVDRYRDHPRVTLIREDGSWKIDTPLVGYHTW